MAIETYEPECTVSDIEYRISEMGRLKRKLGVEGLYFYKDNYSNYICLTEDEHMQAMGIPGAAELLITETYELEALVDGWNSTIKFLYASTTCSNIEHIKEVYLTIKLSGVGEL